MHTKSWEKFIDPERVPSLSFKVIQFTSEIRKILWDPTGFEPSTYNENEPT